MRCILLCNLSGLCLNMFARHNRPRLASGKTGCFLIVIARHVSTLKPLNFWSLERGDAVFGVESELNRLPSVYWTDALPNELSTCKHAPSRDLSKSALKLYYTIFVWKARADSNRRMLA